MTYRLPDFNLTCGIYASNGDYFMRVFRLASICQLRGPQQGPRGGLSYDGRFVDVCTVPLLLLPKGTDIRSANNSATPGVPDIVEIPTGSLRFYVVFYVDDIGKGFSNEHRYALLAQPQDVPGLGNVLNMPPWPVPYP